MGTAAVTNFLSWGRRKLTRGGALDTDEKAEVVLAPEEEVVVPGN